MSPFAIRHVLAPTDLSDSSIPALEYARLFADHFSATLTLMYSDPILTVIGTTTERLIRFASCPVLIVPREAPRRAGDKAEREVAAGAMS